LLCLGILIKSDLPLTLYSDPHMSSPSRKLADGALALRPLLVFKVAILFASLVGWIALVGCNRTNNEKNDKGDEKVIYLPMVSSGPNSLDPVKGSSLYDNKACGFVYQTLLQYNYLQRPLKLEPLLLAEMPDVLDDGKLYRFKLRKDVFFHDDECFPNGKGRQLVAEDVFYSFKRMADDGNDPKSWWLLKDTIVGFDEYRERQNRARKKDGKFDYDLPVEGMKIINDHEFEIQLKQPFFRFLYTLAMFQTSIVPREAVEKYEKKISRHPVGTGPFLLKKWETGSRMTFVRNPKYREEYYPEDPGLNEDGSEPYDGYLKDKELGMYNDAGKRLPIVDRVEMGMYVNYQPMWLKFRIRELDYTTVPAENFSEAYIKRTQKLRQDYVEQGIRSVPVPLTDMIYFGFNMEDKDFGGYDDKHKWIRQAISLAIDWDERNEAFYNGLNIIYDGPIPPSLEGHPEGHTLPNAYRGPDLVRARQLLAKAGHPGGKGLPKLEYYTSRGARNEEMSEMTQRHLAKIGVRLDIRLVDFSTLTDAIDDRRAPFFGLAWGSDYPDAENFLQLFYGPFKSPSSNNSNYDRPEYNEMYERARVMSPSPERTKLYEQMRDMIVEDAPFIGSMGRTRFYLIHDRLLNCKPIEDFHNWNKYLNVRQ
jgi:oligopeptide transport system substrate-binding protein